VKVVVSVNRDRRGQYRASCPRLPGCCANGQSREEAVANIDPVIRGYLASLDCSVPMALEKVVNASGGDVPWQSLSERVAGRTEWASR